MQFESPEQARKLEPVIIVPANEQNLGPPDRLRWSKRRSLSRCGCAALESLAERETPGVNTPGSPKSLRMNDG